MAATLTVRDEPAIPGGEDHVFELTFPTESITVRELIRERVFQEVDDHNRRVREALPALRYQGLVEPSAGERQLNGERPGRRRELDWKPQFERAAAAYEHRQILVLVGDRQTASLDETIEIAHGTEVTFLRLVLLAGG